MEAIVRSDPRRFEFHPSRTQQGWLIRATGKHAPGSVDPDLICRAPTRNVETAVPTVGIVYDAPGPPRPDSSGLPPGDQATSVLDDEDLFRSSASDSEEDSEQVQDQLRRLRQENGELKEERQRLLQEVAALKAENAELRGQSVGPKSSIAPLQTPRDAPATPPAPVDPWQNGADPWQRAAPTTGQPRQPATAAATETTSENLHQSFQEPWEQNDPAMLRVSGCEQEYFANALHGKYIRLEAQSGGRPVYQREEKVGAPPMVLFFWECADDPPQSGWYFCPSVDEECETWAFRAGDSDHPPTAGWVAPYNTTGEVNPSFRVEAAH